MMHKSIKMVNLLETEMEDVARGGADEFFFRHPIPEHDAVTAAASGVAAVGHSEGEAVPEGGGRRSNCIFDDQWKCSRLLSSHTLDTFPRLTAALTLTHQWTNRG